MKIKLLGRNKGATKIPQAFFYLTKMFVSPAGRSVIPANFAPLLSDAGWFDMWRLAVRYGGSQRRGKKFTAKLLPSTHNPLPATPPLHMPAFQSWSNNFWRFSQRHNSSPLKDQILNRLWTFFLGQISSGEYLCRKGKFWLVSPKRNEGRKCFVAVVAVVWGWSHYTRQYQAIPYNTIQYQAIVWG